MQLKYKRFDGFYPKQKAFVDCPTRFTYCLASNKSGKTASMAIWILEQAIFHPNCSYSWVGPTIKVSTIGFDLCWKNIEQSGLSEYCIQNKSKLTITLPNKSIVRFFGAENPDSIYGFEAMAAVMDEASRCREEAYSALLSTLLATNGPIKFIGNPTVKNNWYYRLWEKTYNSPNHTNDEATAFKLTAHDSVKAGIMLQSTFDFAEKNYPRAIFRRDFLAEVPDNETSVFDYEKVMSNILPEEESVENSLNKVRYLGIDLGFTEGEKSDYSVVSGVDKNGVVRFFKRFKASGQELIDKLKAYIGDKKAYIDKTGGGITVYELLKNDCPNLEPYTFSNSSKTLCIENLAHYIHSNKIKYNNIEILINELNGYEIDFTQKGKPTYNNGKETRHDDSVISLALAVLRYKESEDEPNYTFEVYDVDEGPDIDWEGQGQGNYDFSFNIR